MIVGICIDPWKLEIFRRHLDAAKCKYTEHPWGTMTLIKVTTDYVHKLQAIVEAAQRECARVKR